MANRFYFMIICTYYIRYLRLGLKDFQKNHLTVAVLQPVMHRWVELVP